MSPEHPSSRATQTRHDQNDDHTCPAYPPGYARGWMVRNDGAGHWWHNGSLPGTTSIMVRTSTGFCWAALCNTLTQPSSEIDVAIDQMMWNMVRVVPSWKA
jgi:hypothetical protein